MATLKWPSHKYFGCNIFFQSVKLEVFKYIALVFFFEKSKT
jgi:hypothetical protein